MPQYETMRREELIQILQQQNEGVRLAYTGQTLPWHIVRQVQPRRQKIEPRLSVGSEDFQAANQIIEGENLQTMVSLYKYLGQVDLILTDPPYNTGQDFRYNDRWDEDPNDPDLGPLVSAEDVDRHPKWLKFMTPRVYMMKQMLRPGGVLAMCIDHRELFRLGMLLDHIFDGDKNRIGIINWQKSYSPKNNVGKRTHISTSTEYVLVYAKSTDRASTNLLSRSEETNARYDTPPDGDPDPWSPGDLTGPGAATHQGQVYGVQNPFTGEMCYPSEGRCWAAERKRIKMMLEAWGSEYESKTLRDGKPRPALVIKGSLEAAKKAAEKVLNGGPWPVGYWRDWGKGAFREKKYLKDVKRGIIPMTYWADEDYDTPEVIGTTSWDHEQSGHSQAGLKELNYVVGKGHGFDTVKPINLFKKIIQIWCPPKGIVLDPFAGSGTTAHAVLELNHSSDAQRRFILIEQGRPESGDPFARTLTRLRVERAISGERVDEKGKTKKLEDPLPGGFRYVKLLNKIDGDAVLALDRAELLDLLLTSHWDQKERSSPYLRRLPVGTHDYLFGVNSNGEGYFLVWTGPTHPSTLNRDVFRAIIEEARAANLTPPYHVYARICTYAGPNIEFYQIPDRILEKIGFNTATEPFRNGSQEES